MYKKQSRNKIADRRKIKTDFKSFEECTTLLQSAISEEERVPSEEINPIPESISYEYPQGIEAEHASIGTTTSPTQPKCSGTFKTRLTTKMPQNSKLINKSLHFSLTLNFLTTKSTKWWSKGQSKSSNPVNPVKFPPVPGTTQDSNTTNGTMQAYRGKSWIIKSLSSCSGNSCSTWRWS